VIHTAESLTRLDKKGEKWLLVGKFNACDVDNIIYESFSLSDRRFGQT
jgi:hypothetical protein